MTFLIKLCTFFKFYCRRKKFLLWIENISLLELIVSSKDNYEQLTQSIHECTN